MHYSSSNNWFEKLQSATVGRVINYLNDKSVIQIETFPAIKKSSISVMNPSMPLTPMCLSDLHHPCTPS